MYSDKNELTEGNQEGMGAREVAGATRQFPAGGGGPRSHTRLLCAARGSVPAPRRRYSDPTMWTAFLGLHDQSKRSAEGVQERGLKRIISHPSFNDFTYDYDIAVLELERPVEYSSTVRPICLPAATHVFPVGKAIWVTGWGHTYEGGELGCAASPSWRTRLLVKAGIWRTGLGWKARLRH